MKISAPTTSPQHNSGISTIDRQHPPHPSKMPIPRFASQHATRACIVHLRTTIRASMTPRRTASNLPRWYNTRGGYPGCRSFMSHRAMQTTLRQDLLAALPWALLAGAVATAAILALYLLPGWAALPAAVAVLGVPLILTLARGPLAPRRLVLARVLALLAIALMALSAYAFRPTEQSIVHFRPTPQPEVYAGLEAPVLLALGAGALLAALRLARARQDATRPRAVGVGARAGGRVADLLALAGARSEERRVGK